MSKPQQHPPADFYNGSAMRDLMVNVARSLDQSPKEVELVHGIIIKVIHKEIPLGEKISQHEMVEKIYKPVVETINKTGKARKALDTIVSRYEMLPSTETIRVAKEGENSIAAAIIVGLILAGLIIGAACIYYAARY